MTQRLGGSGIFGDDGWLAEERRRQRRGQVGEIQASPSEKGREAIQIRIRGEAS